jgi:hypothetical protein
MLYTRCHESRYSEIVEYCDYIHLRLFFYLFETVDNTVGALTLVSTGCCAIGVHSMSLLRITPM